MSRRKTNMVAWRACRRISTRVAAETIKKAIEEGHCANERAVKAAAEGDVSLQVRRFSPFLKPLLPNGPVSYQLPICLIGAMSGCISCNEHVTCLHLSGQAAHLRGHAERPAATDHFCLAAAVDTLAHVEAKLPGLGADSRPMSSTHRFVAEQAWQFSTT